MNSYLKKYAKNFLIRNLKIIEPVNPSSVKLFKQMYAHGLKSDKIEDMVEQMDESKMDWAMIQLTNSMQKLELEISE